MQDGLTVERARFFFQRAESLAHSSHAPILRATRRRRIKRDFPIWEFKFCFSAGKAEDVTFTNPKEYISLFSLCLYRMQ